MTQSSAFKMTFLGGQVRSYLALLAEMPRWQHRAKFTASVAANKVFPILFRKRPMEVEIAFSSFTLKHRVGQTELSPYLEYKDSTLREIADAPGVNDWIVLDCGANIGLFSLFFRNAAHIIAVEPNPQVHDRLAYNLAANNVRATIVRKAVGTEEGWLRLHLRSDKTTEAVITDHGNTVVESTTIDRLIRDYALARVDLLKLDLEGYEIPALEGAAAALDCGVVRRIYAEFRSDEALQRLDALLLTKHFQRTAVIHHWNALYQLTDAATDPSGVSGALSP